jgi:Fe/S biogenesis protein NfuA
VSTQIDSKAAVGTDAVIRVTPDALEMVCSILAKEANPDSLALFLEVSGRTNGVYTYDLWFGSKSEIAPGDAQQFEGELPVIVPALSIDRLRGAVLDVNRQGGDAGLAIINSNTPPALAAPVAPRGDLEGPVAERVMQVLDEDINPQIAMHGGHAALVSVDGSTAFVEMSGGCQGCGMARATLTQGIAVAITEAVPEIVEVVDVTDHVSGTNPYFER